MVFCFMNNNKYRHGDEELTDLNIGQWKVLQKKQGFRFAVDAILLGHFAPLKKDWQVADLGTGCGIIPFLLLSRQPQLSIDGIEIQPEIADMASRSVLLNQLNQIRIINHDFKLLPKAYNNRYDLVVVNPPYFPLGTGKINPHHWSAIARHEVACTLEDVLAHSARLLKSAGRLAIIHQAKRLDDVLTHCRTYHLTPKRLRFVHPVSHEPAKFLLLEAVKGARSGLCIEQPLFIYQNDQYSAEMRCYYGGEGDE